MKKTFIFIFFTVILTIFLIGLTTAVTGCCYDSSQGICSLNAEKNNCINNSGNWSSDATCNAETRCAKGCCIAGNVIAFTTDRRCEVLSSAYGVTKNFNSGMTASQCYSQSQTGIDGACVFGEDRNCIITSSSGNCSGEFYSGLSCTEVNTTCHTTSNTTCYKDDVFSIDSCGNPDHKTNDCDYASGTICRKEGNNAFCKSLNCAGGKNNGQSWCVGICEEGAPVGSRFFRQYCLNGQIFTEPCADFRAETCVEGETATAVAKCELNDWSSCLTASNDSTACEELEQCKIWMPGSGECVETGSGSIYCGFGNKFYKMNGTRDSMARGEEVTETIIVMDVDASGGAHFVGQDNTTGGKLLEELQLNMCVPKVAGGLEFYPKVAAGSSSSGTGGAGTSGSSGSSGGSSSGGAGGVSTAAETCGKGNKEAVLYFDHDGGFCNRWRLKGLVFNEDINYEDKWGYAGVINLDKIGSCTTHIWHDFWGRQFEWAGIPNDDSIWCMDNCEENGLLSVHNNSLTIANAFYTTTPYSNVSASAKIVAKNLNNLAKNGIIPDPTLLEVLNQRCQAIGDCDGKTNWIGTVGRNAINNSINDSSLFFHCITKAEDVVECTFNYTCAPYKAPAGASDCGRCGSDGFACSEYRCKALGKKCEYYEPEGVQTGICQTSDDNEPPTITLSIEPASPIRPNTAVKINALTNERAECKFDIGVAGTSFEGMNYDFLGEYTAEHNITLNIPGQNGYNESEGYALINHDGEYDVYVRCIDAVGNWNLAPTLISFEVMETPDLLAPILSEFSPQSGSRIAHGQTSKTISFKMNEPAECKWSFSDVEFSGMENNFGCDTSPSDTGVINGYFCSGTLTNITNDTNSETNFYIRCKDQPWLEGIEDDLYVRNANEQSVPYILKPSPELWIKNITPMGELKVSGSNMTTILKIITADGSDNGIAECYWSQSQVIESYVKFFNTNSVTHTQTINIHEGENTFYLACRDLDSQGNEINRVINTTTFNVIIDISPPVIILSYINNQTKEINIVTDELAECRYTNNQTIGCSFEFLNGTSMRTTDKLRHSASGFSGMYYIKCKDQRGFVNIDECGIILKI
jgi:hypothetical protein